MSVVIFGGVVYSVVMRCVLQGRDDYLVLRDSQGNVIYLCSPLW